ncbi:MAG: hypothetical protein WC312_01935 [Candidatus Omnitrophota bacterium]
MEYSSPYSIKGFGAGKIRTGLTSVFTQEHKSLFVGNLQAWVKTSQNENFILGITGTNKGDMQYTLTLSNNITGWGGHLQFTQLSGDASFLNTVGGMYNTDYALLSVYKNLWQQSAINFSVATNMEGYKSWNIGDDPNKKDFTDAFTNFNFKVDFKLGINDIINVFGGDSKEKASDLYSGLSRMPYIPSTSRIIEQEKKQAVTEDERQSKVNELLKTIYANKPLEEIKKEINLSIKDKLEKTKKLVLRLDNGKTITARDMENIDELIAFFSGQEIDKDILKTEFAHMFAAEYYKALLTEITKNEKYDYNAVYELYKLFINGSLNEKGINKGVIDAKKALDEQGVSAATLNVFRSRMLMAPPEDFNWKYYDFMQNKDFLVEYSIREFTRLRYEGERIFFERGKNIGELSKVPVTIEGKEVQTLAYDVDYSMFTMDDLQYMDEGVKLLPRTGSRIEYTKEDEISKKSIKVMEEENIKGMPILYFGEKKELDLIIFDGFVTSFIGKADYKLITHHYYIEGTNIEKSYQKIIVWGENNVHKTPGSRQVMEEGTLKTAGIQQAVDRDGLMTIDQKMTYQSRVVDVNTFDTNEQNSLESSLTSIFRKPLNSIPKNTEFIMERYLSQTKRMEPDGSDAKIKVKTPGLNYRKQPFKIGDRENAIIWNLSDEPFVIQEGEPFRLAMEEEISSMDKLYSEANIKNAKNITKQAKEHVTPEDALKYKETDPSYINSTDPYLKDVVFTFDWALKGILSDFYAPNDENALKLIDDLSKPSQKDQSGFFYTAYNTKTGKSAEFKNPGGPAAWIGIRIAHDIENKGDKDNKKLNFLMTTADDILKIGREISVVKLDGFVAPGLIIPLGPDNRNTASIEHMEDHYTLFRYLGDKIEGEKGAKYRDIAAKIANFLKAPTGGGGAYLTREGDGKISGRFVRGIRDINRLINGERGDDVIDYTVATDVQAWGASLIAEYQDDFKGLDPRTFVHFAEKNCATEVNFNGSKVAGFDFFNIKAIKNILAGLRNRSSQLQRLIDAPDLDQDVYELKKNKDSIDNQIRAIEKSWREAGMISVEWTNYMITAYRHSAEWAEKQGNKDAAEYYRRQAEFYKNEVDKLTIEIDGNQGLPYATRSYTQKADDPTDKTPMNGDKAISAAATATRAMLDLKTKQGKFFDPLIIEIKEKVDLDKKPAETKEEINIKQQDKAPLKTGQLIRREAPKQLVAETKKTEQPKIITLKTQAPKKTLYAYNTYKPKVIQAGFSFEPIISLVKGIVNFIGGLFSTEAEEGTKVTPEDAVKHAGSEFIRSENTGLPISYDGTTDANIRNWSFTFDLDLDNILNIYTDGKDKTDKTIDFLNNDAFKKSGLYYSAYDVRYGNIQEYNNPGGPNAWTGIKLAHYIEKFGDNGNKKLVMARNIADALLGFETRYTTDLGENAGFILLGPGQGTAAVEHNLDHFVLLKYLGDKIEGNDGQKYRDAAKRISTFLRTPVEKGGAFITNEGRFIRGIKDSYAFIQGDRGDNAVDRTVATDAQAWGASVVASYGDYYFKGLNPRTFVDFAEKNCEVEVNFRGKKVKGFDFIDNKLRETITRNNISEKEKELGRKLTREEIEAVTRIPMISVEWTNYMITAYVHAADRAERDGNDKAAENYRNKAKFYKDEVDKLTIKRNGETGLPYATASGMQKSDIKGDNTPENSENSISISATTTRALLDLGIDPLRVEAGSKVSNLPKSEEVTIYKPYITRTPTSLKITDIVRGGYRTPDFIRGLGKRDIVDYLSGCAITKNSISLRDGDIKEWISFTRDGMEMARVENTPQGAFFTLMQFDENQEKEIYREKYQYERSGIGQYAGNAMPVTLPKNITDETIKSLEINKDAFIGKDKFFRNQASYDYVLGVLKNSEFEVVEENNGSGSQRIVFYAPGNRPISYISGGNLYFTRDIISRTDLADFNEQVLLQNLQAKSNDIFPDNSRLNTYIDRFKKARVTATIEFDINHLDAPQQYTAFTYFEGAKQYPIGRLQKGNFGLSLDLIEHKEDNKGNKTVTYEDPRLKDIITLLSSSSAKDAFMTSKGKPDRPFNKETEFNAWLKKLNSTKDLIAHKVFTISDNGRGAIKEKKAFTSIYYKAVEVVRIDRSGLSVIDQFNVKYTFDHDEKSIGDYMFRSWDTIHASTAIENILMGLTRNEKTYIEYTTAVYNMTDKSGNDVKGIVYKIPEDPIFNVSDYSSGKDIKERNLIKGATDLSKHDFVYFYAENAKGVDLELEITDSNGDRVVIASNKERQSGEDTIPFWPALAPNRVAVPDFDNATALYSVTAPYSITENVYAIPVEQLKASGLDVNNITNATLKYRSNTDIKFKASRLMFMGEGKSVDGSVNKDLFKIRDASEQEIVMFQEKDKDDVIETALEDYNWMVKYTEKMKSSSVPRLQVFDIRNYKNEIEKPAYTLDPENGRLYTLDRLVIDKTNKIIGVYSFDITKGIMTLKAYNPRYIQEAGTFSAYGQENFKVLFPEKEGMFSDMRNRMYGSIFGQIAREMFEYEDYLGDFKPIRLTAQEVASKLEEYPDVGYTYLQNRDGELPWIGKEEKQTALSFNNLSISLVFNKNTGLTPTSAISTYGPTADYVNTAKELEIAVPYLLSIGDTENAQKILNFYMQQAGKGPLAEYYHINTGAPYEYSVTDSAIYISKPKAEAQLSASMAAFNAAQKIEDPASKKAMYNFSFEMLNKFFEFEGSKGGFTEDKPVGKTEDGIWPSKLNYYPTSLNSKAYIFLSRLSDPNILGSLPEGLSDKIMSARENTGILLREYIMPYSMEHGTIPVGVREVRGNIGNDTILALEKWNSSDASLWFIEAAKEMKDIDGNELTKWFDNTAKIFGVTAGGEWGIDWSPRFTRPEGRVIFTEATAHFLKVARLLNNKTAESYIANSLNGYQVKDGKLPEMAGIDINKAENTFIESGQGFKSMLTVDEKGNKEPAVSSITISYIITMDNGQALYDITSDGSDIPYAEKKEAPEKGSAWTIFKIILIIQGFLVAYNFVWSKWWKKWRSKKDKEEKSPEEEEYYNEEHAKEALKVLSEDVFKTEVANLGKGKKVIFSDSDIEGAFLSYLGVIYALIIKWNEKNGNKIDINKVNEFAIQISKYLALEAVRGAGDSTIAQAKYVIPGSVNPQIWANIQLYLKDCTARMKADFDNVNEFESLLADIGISEGRFDPLIRIVPEVSDTKDKDFIELKKKVSSGEIAPKGGKSDYDEFVETLPKPIHPLVQDFTSIMPRFILAAIGILWHLGDKGGINIFNDFANLFSQSLAQLSLPVLIAAGVILIINTITEFFSMSKFTSGKSNLKKISGVVLLGLGIFMFVFMPGAAIFEVAALKFLAASLITLEGLYNVISNRSLVGLAVYNQIRPSVSVGRPRAVILHTAQLLSFVGLSILLADAVSTWFVATYAVSIIAVIGAALGFFLVQQLVNYGLWQKWTFISALLAPTRGPVKTEKPKDWDPGKTGVLFVGGQPLASEVHIGKTPEDAADGIFSQLNYMRDNEDEATMKFIKGIAEELGVSQLSDESIKGVLIALYKAEKESGVGLWDIEQLDENSNIDNDLKIISGRHYDPSDRNKIIAAYKLRDWICDINPVPIRGGSAINSATTMVKMARSFKDAGIGEKTVFYIIHNQYDKFGNEKGRPSQENIEKGDEVLQREKLSRLIKQISGGSSYVVFNSTIFGLKAAAMNGLFSVPEEMPYLKSLVIMDRNSTVGNFTKFIEDVKRIRANPDISIIAAFRGTTNVLTPTGDLSRLVEEGHGSFMQGLVDKVGTGWGNIMQIVFWEAFTKLGKKGVSETSLAPDRKEKKYKTRFMDRMFGLMMFSPNAIGISEDYWAVLQTSYSQIGLGRSPQYGLSKAMWHKIRETKGLYELVKALPRWSAGLYQTMKDYLMQLINEYGPESIFERDARRNAGRHFIIAPQALLNVLILPLAIIGDWTSFVGINLLYWVLGTMFNQIETLHGLLATLRAAGFSQKLGWFGFATGVAAGAIFLSPLVASMGALVTVLIPFYTGIAGFILAGSLPGGFTGWGKWFSVRVRDMLIFSSRFIVIANAQIAALLTKLSFEFKLSAVGKGGNAIKIVWSNLKELSPANSKSVPDYISKVTSSYQAIFFIGLFMLGLNFFAMSSLDIMNVLMLWISLVFTSGIVIGPYTHDDKVGKSFGKGSGDIAAKILGYGLGIVTLTGAAMLIGGGFIGLTPYLVVSAGLLLPVLSLLEKKNLTDPKVLRFKTEMNRAYIISLFIFIWFLVVPLASNFSFELGSSKILELTSSQLLSYIGWPVLIASIIVAFGNIQTRIQRAYYSEKLNRLNNAIKGDEALVNRLEPLTKDARTYIHQGAFGYLRDTFKAIEKERNAPSSARYKNAPLASNASLGRLPLSDFSDAEMQAMIEKAVVENNWAFGDPAAEMRVSVGADGARTPVLHVHGGLFSALINKAKEDPVNAAIYGNIIKGILKQEFEHFSNINTYDLNTMAGLKLDYEKTGSMESAKALAALQVYYEAKGYRKLYEHLVKEGITAAQIMELAGEGEDLLSAMLRQLAKFMQADIESISLAAAKDLSEGRGYIADSIKVALDDQGFISYLKSEADTMNAATLKSRFGITDQKLITEPVELIFGPAFQNNKQLQNQKDIFKSVKIDNKELNVRQALFVSPEMKTFSNVSSIDALFYTFFPEKYSMIHEDVKEIIDNALSSGKADLAALFMLFNIWKKDLPDAKLLNEQDARDIVLAAEIVKTAGIDKIKAISRLLTGKDNSLFPLSGVMRVVLSRTLQRSDYRISSLSDAITIWVKYHKGRSFDTGDADSIILIFSALGKGMGAIDMDFAVEQWKSKNYGKYLTEKDISGIIDSVNLNYTLRSIRRIAEQDGDLAYWNYRFSKILRLVGKWRRQDELDTYKLSQSFSGMLSKLYIKYPDKKLYGRAIDNILEDMENFAEINRFKPDKINWERVTAVIIIKNFPEETINKWALSRVDFLKNRAAYFKKRNDIKNMKIALKQAFNLTRSVKSGTFYYKTWLWNTIVSSFAGGLRSNIEILEKDIRDKKAYINFVLPGWEDPSYDIRDVNALNKKLKAQKAKALKFVEHITTIAKENPAIKDLRKADKVFSSRFWERAIYKAVSDDRVRAAALVITLTALAGILVLSSASLVLAILGMHNGLSFFIYGAGCFLPVFIILELARIKLSPDSFLKLSPASRINKVLKKLIDRLKYDEKLKNIIVSTLSSYTIKEEYLRPTGDSRLQRIANYLKMTVYPVRVDHKEKIIYVDTRPYFSTLGMTHLNHLILTALYKLSSAIGSGDAAGRRHVPVIRANIFAISRYPQLRSVFVAPFSMAVDLAASSIKWIKGRKTRGREGSINNINQLNAAVFHNKLSGIIKKEEEELEKEVSQIAGYVDLMPPRSVLLISGCSSTGKSPLSNKISKATPRQGKILGMDRYYKDHADMPLAGDGKFDFDSPEALDMELFISHLEALLKGEEIKMPVYDFDAGARLDTSEPLSLGQDEVLIIEGIHALSARILNAIPARQRFGVFVDVGPHIKLSSGKALRGADLRLLRRLIRDEVSRGIPAIKTLRQWKTVRAAEDKFIMPQIKEADMVINTALPYELVILKKYAVPYLKDSLKIASTAGEKELVKEINRLLAIFNDVITVKHADVPEKSLLNEFLILDSSYKSLDAFKKELTQDIRSLKWLSAGTRNKMMDIASAAGSKKEIFEEFLYIEQEVMKDWYDMYKEYLGSAGDIIAKEMAELFLNLFAIETYFIRSPEQNESLLNFQPRSYEFLKPADAVKKIKSIMKNSGSEGVLADITVLSDGTLHVLATDPMDMDSSVRKEMDIAREKTHFNVFYGKSIIRIDVPQHVQEFINRPYKASHEFISFEKIIHDDLIELARRLVEGGMGKELKFVAYPALDKFIFSKLGEKIPATLGELAAKPRKINTGVLDLNYLEHVNIPKNIRYRTGINIKLLERLNNTIDDLHKLRSSL